MPGTARDPEVERLINEHLEAVDRALASRGLPLSERRSVTGDVEAQIRDMLTERPGGAATAADVEAVLSRLDAPKSYSEGAEEAPKAPAEPPKVSWLAVILALLAPFFLYFAASAAVFAVLRVEEIPSGASAPAGQMVNGPAGWLVFLVALLPVAAPMTILGWVALSRIRRSKGRLYGIRLALFDALFPPLLLLDGLICTAWQSPVAVILALAADGLIAWWAWRKLKVPVRK